MQEIAGYLTGIILIVGFIPYLVDIFRHKTKPERASWLIWGVLGTIAFFSQLASGASWSLVLTGVDTIIVLWILGLSIKDGVGGFTKLDITSLILAGIGIIAWYFTHQPLAALLLVIFVDAIGVTLTIIKTYREPDTETMFAWLMASLAGLLSVVAVGKIDQTLLLYPAYIFLANGLVAATIVLGKRRAKAPEIS